MEKQVLDVSELLTRVEGDRQLLTEILLIFKEEWPMRMRELRDAVQSRDLGRIAKESHGLKGMLANLAAHRAAAAAADLERAGREEREGDATSTFTVLEREGEALLPEVNAHLEKVPS
jgi:two-component system sensor histidine kinase/response regulator